MGYDHVDLDGLVRWPCLSDGCETTWEGGGG